jgi:hypothetical protein
MRTDSSYLSEPANVGGVTACATRDNEPANVGGVTACATPDEEGVEGLGGVTSSISSSDRREITSRDAMINENGKERSIRMGKRIQIL